MRNEVYALISKDPTVEVKEFSGTQGFWISFRTGNYHIPYNHYWFIDIIEIILSGELKIIASNNSCNIWRYRSPIERRFVAESKFYNHVSIIDSLLLSRNMGMAMSKRNHLFEE